MKQYLPRLSAQVNRKGVLDIDSVKGCSMGMAHYPNGGCYGLCYAAKVSKFYGYDFSKSVSRKLSSDNVKQLTLFDCKTIYGKKNISNIVKTNALKWFRIGTMGDPCHDWELTLLLCEWLGKYKIPVAITKHWVTIPVAYIDRFKKCGTVFNTSISALDTDDEIEHRLEQFNRLKKHGIRSVLRVVSCKFGDTENGKMLHNKQEEILKNWPLIDNPLRIPCTDGRVVSGDIITVKKMDMNVKTSVSINDESTYIGKCNQCKDQCGVL
jgi:hypothetical protein